jgi:hypothetical protein
MRCGAPEPNLPGVNITNRVEGREMSFKSKKVAVVCATAVMACLAIGGVAVAQVTGGGTVDACAKKNNGQLRLVGSEACGPSEVAVSWNVEGQTGEPGPQGEKGEIGPQGPKGEDASIVPHEETRILTLPAGPYNGIFGGRLCASGVLVSGGFSVLMPNVEVTESYIGPAFGLDRVYIVRAMSKDGGALPAGDVVKMYVTCLGGSEPAAAARASAGPGDEELTGTVRAAA